MINQVIDLYDYFKLKRPEGGSGYLTTYFRPTNQEECKDRERPCMLVIPGGAYAFVSYREEEPISIGFLAKGYHVCSLNYSVAPNVHHPYQLLEAAMSIIYIRENAEKYNVDTNHISAVGFSAGGNLCAMLGNVDKLYGYIQEFLGDKVKLAMPNAVVLSYGVISYDNGHTHMGSFENLTDNDVELMKKLDPTSLVDSTSTPAFIWHTRQDNAVPYKNSLDYAIACDKAGVPYELHIYDDGPHGLALATGETALRQNSFINESVSTWLDLAEKWLRRNNNFMEKY